ncbi:MAG: hypothetical protein O2973_09510 [Gemmatimonadetes bacterium]|nr:hypothetical protein [Gemmatimonadota bacterium]
MHASSAGTRAGLVMLIAGVAAVGCAYAGTVVDGAPPAWAPWALAGGTSFASVALFVLGAATRRTLSRGIAALLGALFVVLVAAFGAALALTPEIGSGEALLLGLPLRLSIVFYGIGLVPLLILPISFALTFDPTANGPGDAASRRLSRTAPPE